MALMAIAIARSGGGGAAGGDEPHDGGSDFGLCSGMLLDAAAALRRLDAGARRPVGGGALAAALSGLAARVAATPRGGAAGAARRLCSDAAVVCRAGSGVAAAVRARAASGGAGTLDEELADGRGEEEGAGAAARRLAVFADAADVLAAAAAPGAVDALAAVACAMQVAAVATELMRAEAAAAAADAGALAAYRGGDDVVTVRVAVTDPSDVVALGDGGDAREAVTEWLVVQAPATDCVGAVLREVAGAIGAQRSEVTLACGGVLCRCARLPVCAAAIWRRLERRMLARAWRCVP